MFWPSAFAVENLRIKKISFFAPFFLRPCVDIESKRPIFDSIYATYRVLHGLKSVTPLGTISEIFLVTIKSLSEKTNLVVARNPQPVKFKSLEEIDLKDTI